MPSHARTNRHMTHSRKFVIQNSHRFSWASAITYATKQLKSGRFFWKTKEKIQQEKHVRIVWKSSLICAKKNGKFQISDLIGSSQTCKYRTSGKGCYTYGFRWLNLVFILAQDTVIRVETDQSGFRPGLVSSYTRIYQDRLFFSSNNCIFYITVKVH